MSIIGAVDIGGTKISVAMVSPEGELLAKAEGPTAPERGFDDGMARIRAMLEETAAQAGGSFAGLGIGCTGRHDVLNGSLGDVGAFLPGWDGAPIARLLSEAFGVTAVLENDCDAAALGEVAWGAGRGAQKFIYITVSTGIGGGLVFDGQLYRGVGGAHPEIGHHVIDPGGEKCFCGAHGCWESFASGPAMARWWQARYPEPWDAGQICRAAAADDERAKEAVEREARYLGIGLANLITLYAPDCIALGGGVMRSLDLFLPTIRSVIQQQAGLVPHHKVRLVPARYGTEAVLMGAAKAWMLRYGQKGIA